MTDFTLLLFENDEVGAEFFFRKKSSSHFTRRSFLNNFFKKGFSIINQKPVFAAACYEDYMLKLSTLKMNMSIYIELSI